MIRAGLLFGVLLLATGCQGRRAAPAKGTGKVAAAALATAPVVTPLPATPAEGGAATAPDHVVIISEDGLRPDALTPELAPAHTALMKAGLTATTAMTIPQSDTLPSHASMLSGFQAKEHRLHWNSYQPQLGLIHVPTVFSIARAHGLSTAMIVGKPKLRHIVLPGSVDHVERPSYLCGGVSRRAAAYFAEAKPTLMFVHFSDPDEYGHSHGWRSPEYDRAVANSDRCLGTLLAAIDASGLGARTLIIVTADHGGHGKSHSGAHAAVDRQIPWIVRGPGIEAGSVMSTPVDTMDTAATVLSALKLPMPPRISGSPRLVFVD